MEARLRFTRQVLGTEPVSKAEAWLRTRDGDAPVEVHAVAMDSGERVVGVFGLINPKPERRRSPAPRGSTLLTPRQLQVLQYLIAVVSGRPAAIFDICSARAIRITGSSLVSVLSRSKKMAGRFMGCASYRMTRSAS